MKWMIEEAKLGTDQREIIDEVGKVNGKPIWIKGHAGSGKSVVLLHCLSDYLIRNNKANVVVVVFTRALVDLLQTGLRQIPALRNRNIPVYTIYQLNYRLEKGNEYDAIFCDEVQDLPISFIQKMKDSSKQLIIAGDAAQSIYGRIPVFNESPATKKKIRSIIVPIEKKSSTIYRLTKNVIAVLKNVFKKLEQDKTINGKENSEIRLFKASDRVKETFFCWDECEMINRTRPSEINAVLIFKREDIIYFANEVLKSKNKKAWAPVKINNWDREEYDFDNLNVHLKNEGVPLMYIGSKYGSLEEADTTNKVVLMTYHSAKGLDFDAVCLPYLNVSLDSTSNENALMLVALSRAKRDLFISYSGNMYNGFAKFLKNINPQDISKFSETDGEILF